MNKNTAAKKPAAKTTSGPDNEILAFLKGKKGDLGEQMKAAQANAFKKFDNDDYVMRLGDVKIGKMGKDNHFKVHFPWTVVSEGDFKGEIYNHYRDLERDNAFEFLGYDLHALGYEPGEVVEPKDLIAVIKELNELHPVCNTRLYETKGEGNKKYQNFKIVDVVDDWEDDDDDEDTEDAEDTEKAGDDSEDSDEDEEDDEDSDEDDAEAGDDLQVGMTVKCSIFDKEKKKNINIVGAIKSFDEKDETTTVVSKKTGKEYVCPSDTEFETVDEDN